LGVGRPSFASKEYFKQGFAAQNYDESKRFNRNRQILIYVIYIYEAYNDNEYNIWQALNNNQATI
jgi:hypothetical protein